MDLPLFDTVAAFLDARLDDDQEEIERVAALFNRIDARRNAKKT
jgi:hypothetical protein